MPNPPGPLRFQGYPNNLDDLRAAKLLLSLLKLLCSLDDAAFSAAADPWKDVGVIFECLHQLHWSFRLDCGFAVDHWADRFVQERPDVSMETLACLVHGFSRRPCWNGKGLAAVIHAGIARTGRRHEAFALAVASSQRRVFGHPGKPDTAVLQRLVHDPLPGYARAAVGLAAQTSGCLSDGDWETILGANKLSTTSRAALTGPDRVDVACADLLRTAVIRGDVHVVRDIVDAVIAWNLQGWLQLPTAAACLHVSSLSLGLCKGMTTWCSAACGKAPDPLWIIVGSR
jgi:hypothetical protein